MRFQQFSNLEGTHAFLSASQYHWIRYDDEKLEETFFNRMEAAKGTRYHEIARQLIFERIRLAESKQTLNQYVNDAIGFRMTPEQILYYSDNCYGTVDAIHFDEKERLLRIHDLKNGVTIAKMDQLMVYCAIFCLQYSYKPHEITFILRIYQNDDFVEYFPELDEIVHIMDRIVYFDRRIEELKAKVFN